MKRLDLSITKRDTIKQILNHTRLLTACIDEHMHMWRRESTNPCYDIPIRKGAEIRRLHSNARDFCPRNLNIDSQRPAYETFPYSSCNPTIHRIEVHKCHRRPTNNMAPTEEDIAWFKSTFHPIPKPELPDDCLEYSLYIISSTIDANNNSELRLRLREVQKYAAELHKQHLKDYIWQRQGFALELNKEDGEVCCTKRRGQPGMN
jgi:hypothetical protein